MKISKLLIVAFMAIIYLQSVVSGLTEAEKKECLKTTKRTLKHMLKSFKTCNDKLQLHKTSGEEYQKKIGCVVKCVMQDVKLLDSKDMMTNESLKTAIEAHVPADYVKPAHALFTTCLKEHPLDPKDEFCKSYLSLGTCMQGAVAEACGGDMPML